MDVPWQRSIPGFQEPHILVAGEPWPPNPLTAGLSHGKRRREAPATRRTPGMATLHPAGNPTSRSEKTAAHGVTTPQQTRAAQGRRESVRGRHKARGSWRTKAQQHRGKSDGRLYKHKAEQKD
ncbi:hypothetical protein NDU88_004429 [Pleurodeles waltl]|uniref:Uncharacterized protein n=1 Tax=Pleurodeles waltl TaxID=8319 RepID=A0AAV7V1S0_PLEWA|nr:hypothetical protein NDU88_004429 [Pleurodeles waltl]